MIRDRAIKITRLARGLARRKGRNSLEELGGATLPISSSGNGVYALVKATVHRASRGVRVICFTDVLSPREMVERLKSDFDHVDVIVVDEPDETGSHAAARQRALEEFLRKNPGAIEISQYGRPGAITSFWANGYGRMFSEMESAFPDMSALILPIGTCATLRSAAAYKIANRRRWKIIGIDAAGSALLGLPSGRRIFSGFGNGKPTVWLEQAASYVGTFGRVSDEATVAVSKMLLRAGMHMGASSAACVAAALSFREQGLLPHRGRTVVLCPDHGSLYSSTLFNESFLRLQGFGHLVSVPSNHHQELSLTY